MGGAWVPAALEAEIRLGSGLGRMNRLEEGGVLLRRAQDRGQTVLQADSSLGRELASAFEDLRRRAPEERSGKR